MFFIMSCMMISYWSQRRNSTKICYIKRRRFCEMLKNWRWLSCLYWSWKMINAQSWMNYSTVDRLCWKKKSIIKKHVKEYERKVIYTISNCCVKNIMHIFYINFRNHDEFKNNYFFRIQWRGASARKFLFQNLHVNHWWTSFDKWMKEFSQRVLEHQCNKNTFVTKYIMCRCFDDIEWWNIKTN